MVYSMCNEFLTEVALSGFAAVNWSADEDLQNLAEKFGPVLSRHGGKFSQNLSPRYSNDAPSGTYSAHFGFGEFPLHTDLAMHLMPPRLLLLRSITGASLVPTLLSDPVSALSQADQSFLRSAVFHIRGKSRSFLASALRNVRDSILLRWDPVSMSPAGKRAAFARGILAEAAGATMTEWKWLGRGTVLVVDNWRMLHGRGLVDCEERRTLERLFVEEIREQT